MRSIAGSAIADPSPEHETANKNHSASEQAFKEVENADCADAHKVEDRPVDAQIRERLVETLEDSITTPDLRFLHESPLCSIG
jgi:hypothetical protein